MASALVFAGRAVADDMAGAAAARRGVPVGSAAALVSHVTELIGVLLCSSSKTLLSRGRLGPAHHGAAGWQVNSCDWQWLSSTC